MLELTEDQLLQMRQHEHAGFVGRVRAELIVKFPELAGDEGLQQRLMRAHDHAVGLGLESAQARTQFLYEEAFAAGFHEAPAFVAWIRRPGAPAEQRWRDFMALVKARLVPDDKTEED